MSIAVTIRSVPDEVVQNLKLRAAQEGKSLQVYLLELLARETATPSMAELAAEIRAQASADLDGDDVTSAIRQGREREL